MMADDVELALAGRSKLHRYGWLGGVIPTVEELIEKIKEHMGEGGRS
jgi:hypothetical protein